MLMYLIQVLIRVDALHQLCEIENHHLYDHKAGQTEFAVYRHRPHGFSDFPKNFQISDPIQ